MFEECAKHYCGAIRLIDACLRFAVGSSPLLSGLLRFHITLGIASFQLLAHVLVISPANVDGCLVLWV